MKAKIDIQKFPEVSIKETKTGKIRKAAYATFNRELNLDNVILIAGIMRVKGYRVAEPVHIMEAESVRRKEIIQIVDINGEIIPEEKLSEYYLVLDGNHRVHATSLCNMWLGEEKREMIDVPGIIIELGEDETITEYVNEINCTKKEWSKEDYAKGAARIFTEEKLLQKYSEQLKTPSRPNGYSLSTLNHIYCNGKGLSKNDFILLCYGQTEKGITLKKNIIPIHNIPLGDKFIEICKERGFEDSDITKRYLITEFNNMRNSEDGVDFAIDVFLKITADDISMMRTNKKLDEQKVIQHFTRMKESLKKSRSVARDVSSPIAD